MSGQRNPLIFPLNLSDPLTLDFEHEVGGIVSISTGSACAATSIQLAYSESVYYIQTSDNSNGGSGADGLWTLPDLAPNIRVTVPPAGLRGGFRYLTLVLPADMACVVREVTLQFTAAPTMSDLRAYKNHFFSSDALLNRVWYGGAYTTQLCAIDPMQGRAWPPPASGWNNAVRVGQGQTVLVDGAKRDRLVWPGGTFFGSSVCVCVCYLLLARTVSLTVLHVL
jgi:hypothetical protein